MSGLALRRRVALDAMASDEVAVRHSTVYGRPRAELHVAGGGKVTAWLDTGAVSMLLQWAVGRAAVSARIKAGAALLALEVRVREAFDGASESRS